MRPHQWRCISACHEKQQMGMSQSLCAVCQYDKLLEACKVALSFLVSVEWNDRTSETDASDTMHALREAISRAED